MSSCSVEWNERLSAWFDGEVDGDERRRVDAHLAACAGCAHTADDLGTLRWRLRDAARATASDRIAPPAAARWARPTRSPRAGSGAILRPRSWRPVAIVAAGLLAAAGALAGARAQWSPRFERNLAGDLERQHLRSFSRAEPCEFESSDPVAVAGWVDRTLGYRAAIPELAGATLLGARRCALGGELAAHLLYRVGDRALTVFVPRNGTDAERAARGFAPTGPRCTEGPLGERVCVVPGDGQTQLAVSDAEPPALLALFADAR